MINLIVEISKYLIIILAALYTFQCFTVFRHREEEEQNFLFLQQNILMFAIHLTAFIVLYLKTEKIELLAFYGAQVIYLLATLILFRNLYRKASRLIINNMCMLISIGFIIITRLSYDKSIKQFKILVISTIIALVIPIIIQKMKFLRKWTWVYAGVGIMLLALVAVAGKTDYGAKLAFSFAGISLQPSEFVKIIFVFFVAGILYKKNDFIQVVKATAVAAVHVLILVVSTDLGSALIFFITYLIMLYVATKKPIYLFSGLLAGSLASVAAFKLFGHIRVRVEAWQNPFKAYESGGYQIAQSLFAIGTGGWFGMGLCQGAPGSIPVVEQDFVFSAIAEELGGVFALCLILICMSCFIMFVNIAMQIKDNFYKLVALGLGTVYGFQVFLTIGGVTKFIPSTGVTLPLVSYGGSSILSTLIMFAIIQGLYILREDEEDSFEKQKNEEKYNGRNRIPGDQPARREAVRKGRS